MCAEFRPNFAHTSVDLHCCEENHGGIFFTVMQGKAARILHPEAFTCIAVKKSGLYFTEMQEEAN